MKKNKFAQPLYGKIIFIYETDLTLDQMSTIFNPKTFWIDVTDIDCEVGDLINFDENTGLVITKPSSDIEYTLNQLKNQKKELLARYIELKIVSGFTSESSGELVKYDSDRDTQLTLNQAMVFNTSYLQDSGIFDKMFPEGYPVRGYPMDRPTDEEGAATFHPYKLIYKLNINQLNMWIADLNYHIFICKQEGWGIQSLIENSTSKEELEAITF